MSKMSTEKIRLMEQVVMQKFAEARYVQPLDWNFVIPILFKLKPSDGQINWSAIECILRLFDEHQCRNQTVIGEVLYFISLMVESTLLNFRSESRNLCSVPYYLSDIKERQRFPQLMKVPYGNILFPYDMIQDNVTFVLVEKGYEGLLSIFLRHGVMCLPLQDTVHNWTEIVKKLNARL